MNSKEYSEKHRNVVRRVNSQEADTIGGRLRNYFDACKTEGVTPKYDMVFKSIDKHKALSLPENAGIKQKYLDYVVERSRDFKNVATAENVFEDGYADGYDVKDVVNGNYISCDRNLIPVAKSRLRKKIGLYAAGIAAFLTASFAPMSFQNLETKVKSANPIVQMKDAYGAERANVSADKTNAPQNNYAENETTKTRRENIPAVPAEGFKVHTVVKGENLWTIAKAEYNVKGKELIKKHRGVIEANEFLLEDPNKIYPGNKIYIPLDSKPDYSVKKISSEKVEEMVSQVKKSLDKAEDESGLEKIAKEGEINANEDKSDYGNFIIDEYENQTADNSDKNEFKKTEDKYAEELSPAPETVHPEVVRDGWEFYTSNGKEFDKNSEEYQDIENSKNLNEYANAEDERNKKWELKYWEHTKKRSPLDISEDGSVRFSAEGYADAMAENWEGFGNEVKDWSYLGFGKKKCIERAEDTGNNIINFFRNFGNLVSLGQLFEPDNLTEMRREGKSVSRFVTWLGSPFRMISNIYGTGKGILGQWTGGATTKAINLSAEEPAKAILGSGLDTGVTIVGGITQPTTQALEKKLYEKPYITTALINAPLGMGARVLENASNGEAVKYANISKEGDDKGVWGSSLELGLLGYKSYKTYKELTKDKPQTQKPSQEEPPAEEPTGGAGHVGGGDGTNTNTGETPSGGVAAVKGGDGTDVNTGGANGGTGGTTGGRR